MKPIAKYLSIIALLLTIGPPAWFMLGRLNSAESAGEATTSQTESLDETGNQSTMKTLMLVGAVLWFATAPQWLREDD